MNAIVNHTRVILILALATMLLSCDRGYDPVFSEDPDDRLREALQTYNETLKSAPYGWKAVLETGVGVNYFYHFKFHEDGTVTIVSDFNQTTAGTAADGTWIVKALQRPTLSFDTYSYIHLPADPDGSVNGGNNGEGLQSDFEFAFARTTADTLFLDGTQHGSHITFTKATEQDAAILQQGTLRNMLRYITDNTNLRMVLDNKTVTLAFNLYDRQMAAQYLSADESQVELRTSSYTFTTEGIELETPIAIYGHKVSKFTWDGNAYTASTTPPAVVENVDELYFFHPSNPLYAGLGTDYPTVRIPQGSGDRPLPGQSEDFTLWYNETVTSLWEGQYRLVLNDMNLVFNPAEHIMLLDVYITQGTTRFRAQFNYSYTINDNGILKLSFNGANDNAWLIFDTLYGGFLRHLEEDTFQTEYVGGGYGLTGGFFSQESTLFSFSGYLLK